MPPSKKQTASYASETPRQDHLLKAILKKTI